MSIPDSVEYIGMNAFSSTAFYNDETIQTVLSNNMVVETGETTNTEEIEIVAEIEEVYENEYEENPAVSASDRGAYRIDEPDAGGLHSLR